MAASNVPLFYQPQYLSPQLTARQRVGQALLNAGTNGQPVQSWTQGLADVASAGIGGAMMRGANQANRWAGGIGAATANSAPLNITPQRLPFGGFFGRGSGVS
jgi:hypothetical protein